ncbi:histidinol-phosphate transaminase [Virgibacillus byunsanensis]|uniref:Histidinol-phosphate aminotransferase n=1 Tax=Virgibacillus byunsanensis TaxID=570945 RepID=A0ABW3LLI2_9BACI
MNGKLILNQLSQYQPGKQIEDVKKEYNLSHIVKLASNENPFGYSSKVEEQLMGMKHSFNVYPDGYTTNLRASLAKKLHVMDNQLIFGSGSDEIVQMLCRAYLYPGVNTIMATPTFPQYRHNALVEGAVVTEIPTVNGYHDLEAMLHAIDSETKIIWLCSPNNPTGSIIPKDALYDFLNRCPKHVLVVLDEAYYEYIDQELDPEAINLITKHPNLIVLRTFSKAYGLAGLRVGYGVSNENTISNLNVVRGPFNTTSLTQQAAIIALEDQEFIQNSIKKNKEIKQDLQHYLDELGWNYYDSQTNFLLISTPISGDDTFQYLLERGFIVRSGEGLGCPNTIRLTIGSEDDMEQIKTLLGKLHKETSKEI